MTVRLINTDETDFSGELTFESTDFLINLPQSECSIDVS